MPRTIEEISNAYNEICGRFVENKNFSATITELKKLLKEIEQQQSEGSFGVEIEINCKCFLFSLEIPAVLENDGYAVVLKQHKVSVNALLEIAKKYYKNPQLFESNELVDIDRLQEAFCVLFDIYLLNYNSERNLTVEAESNFILAYDALIVLKERVRDFELQFRITLKLVEHFLFNKPSYGIPSKLKNNLHFPEQPQALLLLTNLINLIGENGEFHASLKCIDRDNRIYESLKYLEELLGLLDIFLQHLGYRFCTSLYKLKRESHDSRMAKNKKRGVKIGDETVSSICTKFSGSDRLLLLDTKLVDLLISPIEQDANDSSFLGGEWLSLSRRLLLSFFVDICGELLPCFQYVLKTPVYSRVLGDLIKNADRLNEFLLDINQCNFWSGGSGKNVVNVVTIFYKILRVKCVVLDPQINLIKENISNYTRTEREEFAEIKAKFLLVERVAQVLKDIEAKKQEEFENYIRAIEDEGKEKEAYRTYIAEKAKEKRRFNQVDEVRADPGSSLDEKSIEETADAVAPVVRVRSLENKSYEDRVTAITKEIEFSEKYFQKINLNSKTILDYLKYLEIIIKDYKCLLALTEVESRFSRKRNDVKKALFYEEKSVFYKKQSATFEVKLNEMMGEIKVYYLSAVEENDRELSRELYVYLQIYAPGLLLKNDSNEEKLGEDKLNLKSSGWVPEKNFYQLLERQVLDKKPLPIVKNITELGVLFGKNICIVGGAIRDLLIGRVPEDWDLALKAVSLEGARAIIEEKIAGVSCRIVNYGFPILSVMFPGESVPVQITKYVKPEQRDFSINAFEYYLNTQTLVYFSQSRNDLASKKIVMFAGQDQRGRLRSDKKLMFRALLFAAKLNFSIDESLDASIKEVALEMRDNLTEQDRVIVGLMTKKLFFNGFSSQSLELILKRSYLLPIIFNLQQITQQEMILRELCMSMDAQDKKYREDVVRGNFQHAPSSPSLFFATLFLPRFLIKLRNEMQIKPGLAEAAEVALDGVITENAKLMVSKEEHLPIIRRKIAGIYFLLLERYFSSKGLRCEIELSGFNYSDFVKASKLWNAVKRFNYPMSIYVEPEFSPPAAVSTPVVRQTVFFAPGVSTLNVALQDDPLASALPHDVGKFNK